MDDFLKRVTELEGKLRNLEDDNATLRAQLTLQTVQADKAANDLQAQLGRSRQVAFQDSSSAVASRIRVSTVLKYLRSKNMIPDDVKIGIYSLDQIMENEPFVTNLQKHIWVLIEEANKYFKSNGRDKDALLMMARAIDAIDTLNV